MAIASNEKRGRGRPKTKFSAEVGLEMFGEKAMRVFAGEMAAEGRELTSITIDEATIIMRRLRKEKAAGAM